MKLGTIFALIILFIVLLAGSVNLHAQDSEEDIVNQTENISIQASISDDRKKVNIKYFIAEKFNKPSRGVFIALPKNQDGVWTEYQVINVVKSSSAFVCNVECANKLEWQNEKYEQINEWSQFRLRIGDKDKVLPEGYYFYGLEIEATYNADLTYNFVFLEDWTEEITNNEINLNFNNQQVCSNKGPYTEYWGKAICNENRTSLLLNASSQNTNARVDDTPPTNLFLSLWVAIWPYLLIFILVNTLIYYLWFKLAKDNWGSQKFDRPEFEPPSLNPWQANFLISEGQIDLKNTLLGYILWLNNKKYIHLIFNDITNNTKNFKPNKTEKEITIEILKDLPDNAGLPLIYNQTVKSIAELGLTEGILSSKINPGEHLDLTQTEIKKSIAKFYKQKPLNQPIGWAFGLAIFPSIAIALAFSALQSVFLIGNSWGLLILFAGLFSIPGFIFLLIKWGRLNKEGVEITAYSKRYKYYLENVEKLKLDFSNNPQEGVQKYLIGVPFAACFGVLPKFQKYFAEIIPNSLEINSTNTLYAGYYAATFYTPPSSDGGGFSGGGGGFSGGGGSW